MHDGLVSGIKLCERHGLFGCFVTFSPHKNEDSSPMLSTFKALETKKWPAKGGKKIFKTKQKVYCFFF